MKPFSIVIENSGDENWETYQPEVSLIPGNDYIQIKFTKKTADAVNIYKRRSDEEAWQFIGTAVNSPFDDHEAESPWEYRVRGIKANREVGIAVEIAFDPSDHTTS